MKALFYLLFVIFVKTEARVFKGQCREKPVEVVKHLRLKDYMDIWYEIEWYDDEYPTFDECLRFLYNLTSPKTFTTELKLQSPTDNYVNQQVYNGVGIQFGTDGTLATGPGPNYPTTPNYYVLSTDYDNYAFVWDCFNVNATHYNERMWYFDRDPNPRCRPAPVEKLICKYFDERYIRKTYHGPKCRY